MQLSRLLQPANWLRLLALLIATAVFGFPYVWMLSSAFKPRADIFNEMLPITWRTVIPMHPTLENFRALLFERAFGRAMLNSAILAVSAVVITVLLSSMIAFVLVFLKVRGRGLMFSLVLATMLIPFEARLIPTFLVVNDLGLQDTFVGLLLPLTVDGLSIFLLRQHFLGLPQDLYDAATIDGCSHLRVYWSIMLPNVKPALVTVAFMKFIFAWDAFVWPLVVVRDPAREVISIAIARLFTDQDILWELLFAGASLITVPVILLFLWLQRRYIESATSSGFGGQ